MKFDYYPGGMEMPGRTFNATIYAYGFNGKRKDNEIYGEGNAYDFGARIYDPRIVRLFSLDPLMKKFPDESNYSFASGNPISNIDVDGERVTWWYTLWRNKDFKTIITTIQKTDVFNAIYKRFIKNQDNLVFKPAPNRGYFGEAYEKNDPLMKTDPLPESDRYVTGLGFNGFMQGEYLTADPTLIAKVILHEGIHSRYQMVRAEGDLQSYPNINSKSNTFSAQAQADHEAMGTPESREMLVKGMKQFDMMNKYQHSEDWYQSMVFRVSTAPVIYFSYILFCIGQES